MTWNQPNHVLAHHHQVNPKYTVCTCCSHTLYLVIFSAGVNTFEFSINILDYLPGPHSVLVMVMDVDSRIAADTVTFDTPPLPSVSCSVDNNVLTCNSNNEIATLLCQIDGGSFMPCSTPLNVLDIGLEIGPHSLVVMITDVFQRTRTVQVEFSVESDLMLMCLEVEDDREYVTGIDCSSTGGIGEVSYFCSYDGGSAENCEYSLFSRSFRHI